MQRHLRGSLFLAAGSLKESLQKNGQRAVKRLKTQNKI